MPADAQVCELVARAEANERLELARAADEHGFWPYFRHLEGRAGPVVRMHGGERLMLGSNNYLGLTGNDEVVRGARDALDRYGTALTGSRLLNGTLALHDELEESIADWLGTESALVFTTGYQANLGALAGLLRSGDTVVCDSANHASIIDGITLSGATLRPYRHNRVDRLAAVLDRLDGPPQMIIVDGVFSMEGDVAELPEIERLAVERGSCLVVDEAHGIGVLGDTGAGACEAMGSGAGVTLRVGTFSKSLASCGGFVAGPKAVIEHLRIEARSFLFTAAGVPAAIGAALAAVRIARSGEGDELRGRLAANARHLSEGLSALGYRVVGSETRDLRGEPIATPIIAVMVGDDVTATCLWKALFDAGVYVNVAAYPAVPRNRALLRASVMATHSPEQLDRALDCFEAIREEAEEGVFADA